MTPPVPAPPSTEAVRRALREFQITVDDAQVSQIQRYMKMLLTWNEKVNLTAIRDPLEILYRHFCESMYAAEAVPLETGRLADVGETGVIERSQPDGQDQSAVRQAVQGHRLAGELPRAAPGWRRHDRPQPDPLCAHGHRGHHDPPHPSA